MHAPIASAVDCVFGYTGRLFDEDTGLQNNLNRWYDPAVGRWLSEDPIGFEAEDPNLYRYVLNNPIIATDPYGKAPNQEGATDPDHVVKRIHEMEAEGNMTADEILNALSDEHRKNTNRYFYTDEYGWIDIRHFAKAAATAHGLGPAGSEVTQILGFLVECRQWYKEKENGYHSAFSPEDLPSNAAGSHFGEDYVGHTGNSLYDAIKAWMKASGARAKGDQKACIDALPATDPASGPKGPGSQSSPGGTSRSTAPGATPVIGGSQ